MHPLLAEYARYCWQALPDSRPTMEVVIAALEEVLDDLELQELLELDDFVADGLKSALWLSADAVCSYTPLLSYTGPPTYRGYETPRQ